MDLAIAILVSLVVAATPLVFAAVGEVVVERAGVLNLGVEGMMIVGAVAGFAAASESGSVFAGFASAIVAGVLLALLFGVLTQWCLTNQVATGLALTIFGLGLAALAGKSLTGQSLPAFPRLHWSLLSELPVLGPVLFRHDVMVYVSLALAAGVGWFFARTHAGLVLRAIGEDHDAAHALGYRVRLIRLAAIAFGGACAGLGGAYLSLVQTPLWVEDMTAGRGWIALAIVVFGAWRIGRVLVGAYLFGGVAIVQLHAQAFGISVPAQYLSMAPYLLTIVVLTLITASATRRRLRAPAALGRTFSPAH